MTTNNEGIPAQIAVLEARVDIAELKARYARGADAVFNDPGPANAAVLADLFTEDGVLDLGPFGRYEGRANLLNAFENILPQGTKWSTHYIVSPLLTVNGNEAVGNWYYQIHAVPAAPPGAGLIQILGSYADAYVKVAGGWKIKESIATIFAPPIE